MATSPSLSDQLRDIAIHAPIGFGEANRSVLFRAADELDVTSRHWVNVIKANAALLDRIEALEAKEPVPVRKVVKESGIS